MPARASYAAPRSTSRKADRSTRPPGSSRRCWRSPDKSLDLLPGGKARAAKLADLAVGTGAARQTITLWAVTGISTSPLPIWADANNKFFGADVRPRLAAGGVRRRTAEDRGGAGEAQWRRRRPGWSRRWSPCPRDRWRSPASGSSTPTRRASSPTRRSSSTRA